MSAHAAAGEDDHDRLLGQAIDAYVEALNRGEAPSPREWAGRYPDLAGDLEECLDALAALDEPASRATQDAAGPGVESPAGVRPDLPDLRGYTLLHEIGRGGMGVVYQALQRATKRVVAVKLLAAGLHASAAARRRFEREVELAAALDHPGIVRVFESGDCAGQAYCVMEYVHGRTLHAFLQEGRPGLDARLRLFVEIAEAVQYAHLRGIVHRDLKPTNILIDAGGRPRILDFGLARLATATPQPSGESSLVTQDGQLIGTLPYLSPEHAAGTTREVDVRSDTYALGVILYEMLTGRLPYDTSGTLDAALHNICHVIPQRPSRLRTGLSRDLDAVVLKALEKQKDRRYQSAAEMAAEVRCVLRGEPVEANRTAGLYLLRKAYARHRTQVQLIAAGVGLVIISALVILSLYLQVRRERNLLSAELHVSQLRRAMAHLAAGHDKLAEELLWPAYLARPDRPAYWSLLSYYVRNPLRREILATGWITCAAFRADGLHIAYGNLDGRVVVAEADTGRPSFTAEAHPHGGVAAVVISPDGRRLLTGGSDGALACWDLGTGHRLSVGPAHTKAILAIHAAPAGMGFLSVGSDGKALRWAEGDEFRPTAVCEFPAGLSAADFTRAAEKLAAARQDGEIVVVNVRTGHEAGRMRGLSTPAEAVRFSPDGRRLATWSGGRVAVWNLGTGTLDWSAEAGLSEPRPTALWDFPPDAKDRPATPHVCWRPALDWSEDGGLLASATWGASIRLWDADDGHLHGELRSQSTAVYAVAFARGARHMAAGDIGSVRIWDLDLHPGALTWQTGSATTRTWIGLTATGLVWGEAPEGVIHLVDTAAPRTPREWRMAGRGMTAMAVDPRGGRVVAADEGGGVSTWDMRSGTQDRSWSTGSGVVRALAFSHDGTSIATGDDHGNLEIRQAANGSLLRSWRAHGGTILALAFSPDGAFLLSGGTDWHARLWRLRAAGDDPRKTGPPGRPVQDWRHIEWVNAVAFSPDSRHMATGSADLLAFVGHVGGPPDLNSPRHAHWINAVAFLDQGSVLATGGNDEMLRFWDSHTGQELANLPSPGGPIQGLAASGEGRFLAVAGKRAVQLIDLHAAGSLIDRRRR